MRFRLVTSILRPLESPPSFILGFCHPFIDSEFLEVVGLLPIVSDKRVFVGIRDVWVWMAP